MLELAPAILVSILMVLTIFYDLRFMRIPNWLSLIGIAVFLGLVSWTLPLDEALWRAGIACAALVVGIVLFALRIVGAGDVKILSVLLLFVPTSQLSAFAFSLSVALIAAIVAVLVARRFWEADGSAWAFLRHEKRLPMGLAIGAVGLISVLG